MAPPLDLERVYAECSDRLRRFLLLKTGDAELAADLAQECFTRLIERSVHDWPDKEMAYLYTVATRLLIDHRRNHNQARTESADAVGLEATPDPAPGPDLIAELRQRLLRTDAALRELPQRTRQIFQLCRFEEYSYQQVAQRLDISTSSVQKHLATALEFIRERVQGR